MLKILYQDPAIVVCEKPFRVLSTDEPGGMPDCIRQALGRPEAEVRTVHRLDQVVGGLMVYALTPQAASDLSRQIREDRFLKEYLAVIHWQPREKEGTFLDLLGRNPKTRKTYVAKLPGKGIQQAVLHYRVVDSRQGFSLVSIRLETGRTHQIRIHMKSIGYPLIEDYLYNPDMEYIGRQALHSARLCFPHPVTGKEMRFTAALPEDMRRVLEVRPEMDS